MNTIDIDSVGNMAVSIRTYNPTRENILFIDNAGAVQWRYQNVGTDRNLVKITKASDYVLFMKSPPCSWLIFRVADGALLHAFEDTASTSTRQHNKAEAMETDSTHNVYISLRHNTGTHYIQKFNYL